MRPCRKVRQHRECEPDHKNHDCACIRFGELKNHQEYDAAGEWEADTEATVREAVTAAISAQPADAREYLKATCQRLKGERNTVPSKDNGATRALLAAQAAHGEAVAKRSPEERAATAERLAKAREAVASVALASRVAAIGVSA